jgi:hypothetical protein
LGHLFCYSSHHSTDDAIHVAHSVDAADPKKMSRSRESCWVATPVVFHFALSGGRLRETLLGDVFESFFKRRQ